MRKEVKKLAEILRNPKNCFRGAPFWAWNAKIEESELRRQIRQFHAMGLGGFFMHSRVGLDIEYLSDAWFSLVRACIDEAKSLGMNAWLYDEDRWPSGAAGGYVTEVYPEFRARKLYCEVCEGNQPIPLPTGRLMEAWFAIRGVTEKGGDIQGYRELNEATEPLEVGESLVVFYDRADEPTPWYNNGTNLDVLNPKAVAKFIEITHERYQKEVGSQFGKTVPGIFTDEPSFHTIRPWTPGLEKRFLAEKGYRLQAHFPELFWTVNGEVFSVVRYHFMGFVSDLFIQAFVQPIATWCKKHDILMTGHYLMEDDLRSQTVMIGDVMRAYQYMGVPGMDLLMETTAMYRTAKQVSSVAHQVGRHRRITETYGCTGWDFPLAGHKALGDWQLALGINFRCQHLAWYSMEGMSKRDYPASISFQSPWAGIYKTLEDYYARMGSVLFAEGMRERRDILVLHPIESMWGIKVTREKISEEERRVEMSFLNVTSTLLAAHLDFDYGSESKFNNRIFVKNGKWNIDNGRYRICVIPEMVTIRPSTVSNLLDFIGGGGHVFTLGEPPQYQGDGRMSEVHQDIFSKFETCTLENLVEKIERVGGRTVSITQAGREAEGVLYMMTQSPICTAVFVNNTGMPMPSEANGEGFRMPRVLERQLAYPEAELRLYRHLPSHVYSVDSRTGVLRPVAAIWKGQTCCIPCGLVPLESRCFVLTDEDIGELGEPELPLPTDFSNALPIVSNTQPIPYTLSEGNVMVLDHPRYALETDSLGDPTFILEIDNQIRRKLNVPLRGTHRVQPWKQRLIDAEKTGEIDAEKRCNVHLEYTWDCAVDLPAGAVQLAIEHPEVFVIELNGERILDTKTDAYWVDPAIRLLRLPKVRIGTNTLRLTCTVTPSFSGLEAIYLVGAFGVRAECEMVALPKGLLMGDWVDQGLENYGGNVTYHFRMKIPPTESGKRRYLSLPAWRGSALGVAVAGGASEVLAWPPYGVPLDLEKALEQADALGEVAVDVTVYGHRRNQMGPFYANGANDIVWVDARCLCAHEHRERTYVPCGLLAAPVVQ